MSLLICGDTHNDYDIRKLYKANLRRNLKSDTAEISHLIVCGDWGAIWNDSLKSLKTERYLVDKFYGARPWETLVLLGNHEGYDRIAKLPWMTRYGAPVQQVSEKIFILQNGNLYTVAGKSFFVFGGDTL